MVAHRVLTPEIFVQIKFPHPKIIQGGSFKKLNIKQFFKTASCFVIIVFVFIASIFTPVFAVSSVFEPKDYIYGVDYSESIEYIIYKFDIEPYFSVQNQASGTTANGYGEMRLENVMGTKPYVFRVYPLGTPFTPGRDNTSGLLDIEDFKSKAVFELSCRLNFNAEYLYRTMAAGTTEFYFVSYVYLCYYDVNGTYIDQQYSGNIRHDVELISALLEGQEYEEVLDIDVDLQIPDGAVYASPCILVYLYPPAPDADHLITSLRADCKDFQISVAKNLLVEQSETMKAVEDELADLNEKTDTVLNGTPEQNQHASDKYNDVQNTSQDVDELLSRLDSMSKFDPSDNFDVITNFLDTPGWSHVVSLISPVTQWDHASTLMLIVIAFATISVIIFGR